MSASVHTHFTSVRVSAVYFYTALLAPIDCEFASRVMERKGKKGQELFEWVRRRSVRLAGQRTEERQPVGKWMSAWISIEQASVEGDNTDECNQLFCYPGSSLSAIIYSYYEHKTVSTDNCSRWLPPCMCNTWWRGRKAGERAKAWPAHWVNEDRGSKRVLTSLPVTAQMETNKTTTL